MQKLEMIASWMSFFTVTSVVYCVHVLFFLWGSKQSDSIVEPERKEEGFSLSFLERTVPEDYPPIYVIHGGLTELVRKVQHYRRRLMKNMGTMRVSLHFDLGHHIAVVDPVTSQEKPSLTNALNYNNLPIWGSNGARMKWRSRRSSPLR